MISREADYAIRALLRLGMQEETAVVSTSALAEEMEIPYRFLRRILRKLLADGFVTSVRGKQGGVCLARAAGAITLLDIVRAMHPDAVRLNACIGDPGFCNRSARCVVHTALQGVQEQLEQSLHKVSLATLIRRELERKATLTV